MVWRAMIRKWRSEFYCIIIFILLSEIHGCFSLNAEAYALLQFRAKVESDTSGALADWLFDDLQPCSWSGVRCLDGKVHILDLHGLDLEGSLAPELGTLSHLKVLDLSQNCLSGSIPQELGRLSSLEILDLRDNKLTGHVPSELGGLHSLKRLLLSGNKFEDDIPLEIGKLSLLTDFEFNDIVANVANAVGCTSRKLGHCTWQSVFIQSKKSNAFEIPGKRAIARVVNLFPMFNAQSVSSDIDVDRSLGNVTDDQVKNVRRVLFEQSSNLAALSPNAVIPTGPQTVLSRSSGSFPAILIPKKVSPALVSSPTPSPEAEHASSIPVEPTNPTPIQSTTKKSGVSTRLIVGLSVGISLFIVAAAALVLCRSRAAKTIGPWKTGLSGQLQKAFITGVPKLNRGELETACEEFSNIIITNEGVSTLYKGTLSSGVEIAVASTDLTSIKQWSRRSELIFRKKIDTFSRMNHKNFVNLIGFCEENEPFTRMMVFEYAPNGTLHEHLHVEDMEQLDWIARMRIIMGIAYCIQHMHDLNPPLPLPNLTSRCIFLTDDYAAKIGDLYFWEEFIGKQKNSTENETEHSELPPLADVDTNVYFFGLFLLEIISGRLPFSEEEAEGDLINWATEYLNDKKRYSCLVDSSLKSFKANELDAICEVIVNCIQQDPRLRLPMKDIVWKLYQEIGISPEQATPRLSPLWWAELEILSAEAA